MLLKTLDDLDRILSPIRAGDVALAGFDTETSEVVDGRFTPYGTPTRIAGFSISYDLPRARKRVEAVDVYLPVRHRPYDWRRRPDLIRRADAKNSTRWLSVLTEDEGVLLPEDGGGWAEGWDPNVDPVEAFRMLDEAMQVAGVVWGAHNWGFDGPMLDVEGVRVPWGRLHESQFLSTLTDERAIDRWDEAKNRFAVSHALKAIGEDVLGRGPEEQKLLEEAKEALGEGSGKLQDYGMLPLRTCVAPYAAQDTRLVLEVIEACMQRETWQVPEIRERYERELRLIEHVVAMMREGVHVDPEIASELGEQAEAEFDERTVKVAALAEELKPGLVLNLTHPETLGTQLYDELRIPTYRGNTDTRAATLKMVAKRLRADAGRAECHYDANGLDVVKAADLIDGILGWRSTQKEITAFYRPLQTYGADGTLHPILRQMAAATTRMSAAKPNVQQVKKKGEIRRAFTARPDTVFVFLDYDQIEMRLAAHYSAALPKAFERLFYWPCTMAKRGSCKGKAPHGPKGDPGKCREVIHTGWSFQQQQRPKRLHLYEGFMQQEGFDPHQRMADVSGENRDVSKTANFCLLYGGGFIKLAETLDVELGRAEELWHFFWDDAYPELQYLRAFIDERLRTVGARAKFSHQGHIRTLKGARICLDSGFKGMNYLIQRSAREVFGDGLLDVAEWCRAETGGAYFPLVPVHDEIVLQVQRSDYDVGVLRKIRDMMAEAGALSSVPLTVGCEVGETDWRKGAEHRSEVDLG